MKKLPSTAQIFTDLAKDFGAKVMIDDEYGYAGMVTFPNGLVRYFKYNHIDINTCGASEIARDKDYAGLFMSKLGYKTIEGKTFFSKEWAETIGSDRTGEKSYDYAEKIGYPIYVKPNNSGLGFGVSVAHTKEELIKSIEEAFIYDKIVLVQKAYEGLQDFRLVVFNGEFICAYKKTSLSVLGDGKKTIRELFHKKIEEIQKQDRKISVTLDDYRINFSLKRSGLEPDSVLKNGETLQLLPNANMSQGASGEDITEKVSEEWKEWAIKLSKDMNLKLCGIDILSKEGLEGSVGDYVILEVNHSPGLEHYSTLGEKAKMRVKRLYRNIFEYLSHE